MEIVVPIPVCIACPQKPFPIEKAAGKNGVFLHTGGGVAVNDLMIKAVFPQRPDGNPLGIIFRFIGMQGGHGNHMVVFHLGLIPSALITRIMAPDGERLNLLHGGPVKEKRGAAIFCVGCQQQPGVVFHPIEGAAVLCGIDQLHLTLYHLIQNVIFLIQLLYRNSINALGSCSLNGISVIIPGRKQQIPAAIGTLNPIAVDIVHIGQEIAQTVDIALVILTDGDFRHIPLTDRYMEKFRGRRPELRTIHSMANREGGISSNLVILHIRSQRHRNGIVLRTVGRLLCRRCQHLGQPGRIRLFPKVNRRGTAHTHIALAVQADGVAAAFPLFFILSSKVEVRVCFHRFPQGNGIPPVEFAVAVQKGFDLQPLPCRRVAVEPLFRIGDGLRVPIDIGYRRRQNAHAEHRQGQQQNETSAHGQSSSPVSSDRALLTRSAR